MSRLIQLQMDDFILILFHIFLVESAAELIQVFYSITPPRTSKFLFSP